MTATPGPDRGRWQNRFDSSLTRMSLLAEVLPRAVLSSRSASHRAAATGIPPSAFGVRQVGETALDEFFIAGFSLLRAVPDEDDIRANVDRDQTFMVAVIASIEPVVIFWPIRLISPSAMSMARTAR